LFRIYIGLLTSDVSIDDRTLSNRTEKRNLVFDGLILSSILTSATSLPATPPYRPLFECGHRARLPPQQRHLEDAGFTTLHIDSLCIWFFFYIIDQRPIRQNVYITRGFFRGVPSYSEDLCRVPGAFIVLFPQSLCSFLNLIFQSSLTRFQDLEREKFASTELAEIGVRELLLKPPSRLSEFCI
jgi:hypothetical protein